MFKNLPKNFKQSVLTKNNLLVGLVLAFSVIVFLIQNPSLVANSQITVIEFTDTGFVPKEVQIDQDSTVRFVNKTDRAFWPASDLHPTHTLYADFDAKQPVAAGAEWIFTFTKTGKWSFHNHLEPVYTGTITVGSAVEDKQVTTCDNVADKPRCWSALLEFTLQEKGLPESFDLVEKLYQSNSEFANDCHGYLHKIGLKAYEIYNLQKDVAVSAKAYICGYGFYHAFMETLLHTSKDQHQAQEFCDYLGEKLATENKFARLSCYHGIGHGLMPDYPLPEFGTNVSAMVKKPLEFCQSLSVSTNEEYQCANGVFNVVSLYLVNEKGGLKLDENDPFKYCRAYSGEAGRACYDQMNTSIYSVTNGNFQKALSYVEKISDESLANSAMNGVGSIFGGAQVGKSDYQSFINACRNTQDRLYSTCRNSFLGGMIEAGNPGKEYEQGFVYCALFGEKEKGECLGVLFDFLDDIYPVVKLEEVCGLVAASFQDICSSSL